MRRWPTRVLRLSFSGYVAFIVVLSVTPSNATPLGNVDDKLAHVGAYVVMALLGVPLTSTTRGLQSMVFALVGVGAVIEALQALIPYRSASGWDLVANAMGVLLGALSWAVVMRRRTRPSREKPASGA